MSTKKSCWTTVRERERGTNERRQRPYLSELRRPNEDVPQGQDQFVSGDAMGVVRRLERVIQRGE